MGGRPKEPFHVQVQPPGCRGEIVDATPVNYRKQAIQCHKRRFKAGGVYFRGGGADRVGSRTECAKLPTGSDRTFMVVCAADAWMRDVTTSILSVPCMKLYSLIPLPVVTILSYLLPPFKRLIGFDIHSRGEESSYCYTSQTSCRRQLSS